MPAPGAHVASAQSNACLTSCRGLSFPGIALLPSLLLLAVIFIAHQQTGADPRIVDSEGRTAMHYAVSNDNARCLRVLLEHAEGIINARDARGRSALHLAISAEVLTS